MRCLFYSNRKHPSSSLEVDYHITTADVQCSWLGLWASTRERDKQVANNAHKSCGWMRKGMKCREPVFLPYLQFHRSWPKPSLWAGRLDPGRRCLDEKCCGCCGTFRSGELTGQTSGSHTGYTSFSTQLGSFEKFAVKLFCLGELNLLICFLLCSCYRSAKDYQAFQSQFSKDTQVG